MAFLAVLAVWCELMEQAPVQRRIGALADRREALKRDLTASKRRAPQVSRGISFAKRTVDKLKLMRGQTAAQAAKNLSRPDFARTIRLPYICSLNSACRWSAAPARYSPYTSSICFRCRIR